MQECQLVWMACIRNKKISKKNPQLLDKKFNDGGLIYFLKIMIYKLALCKIK